MVIPFTFSRIPMIHFGPGKLDLLPVIIRKHGTSLMLVTGKGSFLSSDRGIRLMEKLTGSGIAISQIFIPGEPSPGIIDNAVVKATSMKPDVVVAIGGGSAIDAAKSISAMIPVEGSVKDYLEGVGTKEHPGRKIPFIAIPTTAGTGSEATKNAVISETGRDGYKRSLRHENLVPDVAIVDPLLSVTCSPEITAASGMDCFTQLTEAYLSTKANAMTDSLALKGIEAVMSSLLNAWRDGNNTGARSGMSFAALLSGICLANAGLGVVHGFAASAGALYEIPHGIVCGTLMAKANELNVRSLRRGKNNEEALYKYSELGRLILGNQAKHEDYYIDGFINYLHNLTETLKLPLLGRFGLKNADVEIICRNTDLKNNPAKLEMEELEELLESRI